MDWGASVKLAVILTLMMTAICAIGAERLLVPAMESDSTPAPFALTAGGCDYPEYGSDYIWEAFDHLTNAQHWLPSNASVPLTNAWVKVDTGASTNNITVWQIGFAYNVAKAARLEGSVNDSSWTMINNQTNVTTTLSGGVYWTPRYTNSVVSQYRYFRLSMDSDNLSSYISEFLFFTDEIPVPACAVLGSTSGSGVSVIEGNSTGIAVLQ